MGLCKFGVIPDTRAGLKPATAGRSRPHARETDPRVERTPPRHGRDASSPSGLGLDGGVTRSEDRLVDGTGSKRRFQRAGGQVPPSGRVTISDVAAASGVGVGTVSRVINGGTNVRESTRRSVLTVIKQLGYRPSYLAASLSRGTPRTIAIVVPHLTTPSAVMRLAGALAVLDGQGYDTVVCNVDTPEQRNHHLTALTSRYRVDGVIVVSLRLSRQWLASFRRAEVPLVAVDAALTGVPHTVTDDVAGGRMATEHLLSLGHRRIGFVGDATHLTARTDLGFTASQQRLCGYQQALQNAGLEYDIGLVRRGPHGAANAEALAAELLALTDPP